MSERRWAAGLIGLGVAVAVGVGTAAGGVPTPDHVVIVIEENRSDADVYGDPAFPYFNSLADNAAGVPTAKFTGYEGITHPSQPNYVALFSGDTQGVDDNEVHPFSTFSDASNIGAKLIHSGRSFVGYSEDQPAVGYQGFESGNYARRHNPWANWDDASVAAANRIPDASNRPFAGAGNWPAGDFSQLPTLSIVVPNLLNDGHDTEDDTADTWLHNNLGPYATWAMTHNSLLIVTWDEDEGTGRIPTIFSGPMVRPGVYDEPTSHYGVLRTLEAMYGLTHDTADTQSAATLADVWAVPEPTMLPLAGLAVVAVSARRARRSSVVSFRHDRSSL